MWKSLWKARLISGLLVLDFYTQHSYAVKDAPLPQRLRSSKRSLPLSNVAIFLLTLTSASNARSPVLSGSGQGGFAITLEVKEASRRLTPVRETGIWLCQLLPLRGFVLSLISNWTALRYICPVYFASTSFCVWHTVYSVSISWMMK